MKRILFLLILASSISACVTLQEKFTVSQKVSQWSGKQNDWSEGKWSKEMNADDPKPMKNVINECRPFIGLWGLTHKITQVRIHYASGRTETYDCDKVNKEHH